MEDRHQLTFRDIRGRVIEKLAERIQDLRKESKYTRRLHGFPAIERKLKADIKNMKQGNVNNADIIEARGFIDGAGYAFRDKQDNESFKEFRERMGNSELVLQKLKKEDKDE